MFFSLKLNIIYISISAHDTDDKFDYWLKMLLHKLINDVYIQGNLFISIIFKNDNFMFSWYFGLLSKTNKNICLHKFKKSRWSLVADTGQ